MHVHSANRANVMKQPRKKKQRQTGLSKRNQQLNQADKMYDKINVIGQESGFVCYASIGLPIL